MKGKFPHDRVVQLNQKLKKFTLALDGKKNHRRRGAMYNTLYSFRGGAYYMMRSRISPLDARARVNITTSFHISVTRT